MKKIIVLGSVICLVIVGLRSVNAEESIKPASSQTTPPKEIKLTNQVDRIKEVEIRQIDTRVENLKKLIARIQEMKKVSEADKTANIFVINNVITNLTNLKNDINNATSTASLKTTKDAITKNTRVYALIMPQINTMISADKTKSLVENMRTTTTKLEQRLNQLSSTTKMMSADADKAKTAISEIKSKLSSAYNSAEEAIKLVSSLAPDQGDKSVMESNNQALKNAKNKLQLAQNDIVSARKLMESVSKSLFKGQPNKTKSATSTSMENIKPKTNTDNAPIEPR